MQSLNKYIFEKLNISKSNNIDLSDVLLDISPKDFYELKTILTAYFIDIYGKSEVTVSDTRFTPVKWSTVESIHSRYNVEVGDHYSITITKNHKVIDKIEVGKEHSVNNKVIFRCKIDRKGLPYSRAIPNTSTRMYKLGTNFLQWLKDLKEYAYKQESSCQQEIQLLKSFRIE